MPVGAVSSGAWCAVCKRVLSTSEEIFKDMFITPAARELLLTLRSGKEKREMLIDTAPNPFAMPTAPVASEKARDGAMIESLGIEHDKLD
jgi:hypothetical protein